MAEKPVDFAALMAEAQAAREAGDADRAGRLYRRVVRIRPAHAGAWLARIELALAQGQARRALRQCAAALSLIPGHRVALLTKRARALEACGDRAGALALLVELRTEAPDDLPLVAALAGMAQRAGDLETADASYAEVIRLRPGHAVAWLVRAENALARGAPEEALAIAEEGAAHCPGQAAALGAKRVRALEALGRLDAALALAGELRAAAPGDPQLALSEAGLMRKTGDLAAAEAGYAAALARQPGHVGAWLGRIDIALTAGDPDRALVLAEEALTHLPGHPALVARQAGLMLHMGRPEAAIAVLTAALEADPSSPRLRLELARAELQAGRAALAEAHFAACLERDPGDEAARLGLAEAHEAQGDPGKGRALLEGHEDASAALGLKAAELGLQAGQGAAQRALLDRLAQAAERMSEPELLRLFKLGEQADHAGAALAVVGAVAGRARISPLIAQFLMGRARVIVSPEAGERVRDALERRLAPSRVPEFRAFAGALLSGPEEALAQARADLPSPRDTQGAALMGERLLDAGHAATAFRYLRRCVTRWPGALHLRRQFLRACIDGGRLAEGQAWLDALEARFPGLDLGFDRMHLMTQEGRLEETFALARAREAAGLKTLSPRQFLDLALALGDIGTSAQMAARVQRAPGAGRQNAAHFSTTLHGAQFNELRLYAAARDHALAAGEDPEAVEARLARDFFHPAKRIVAAAVPGLGPRPCEVTVPRRIFQYWNTARVPGEVAALMQGWQAAEGFEYQLYDRARALSFLREAFGPRHVRAFQLANSPAEECDFLRLCLLYKLGGIYVDADDRRAGDPARLIAEGPGLIVVSEPWGAIANNVICAPPGHPALLWALQTAGRSLLARENDGTWFKTGPGLVTRAVAAWLGEATAEEIRAGLTVLPLPALRPHVQPHVRLGYKTSGAYWNARDRHAPRSLTEALSALA